MMARGGGRPAAVGRKKRAEEKKGKRGQQPPQQQQPKGEADNLEFRKGKPRQSTATRRAASGERTMRIVMECQKQIIHSFIHPLARLELGTVQ